MGNKQGKAVGGVESGGEGGGVKSSPHDQYLFPFENIVFEGGPNQLLPYIGAVRVLEEAGVWKNVLRLAGSGSGALLALLLSIGYNSHQLEKFFQDDIRTVTQDHCCGSCCIGVGMRRRFGWNENKKLIGWLGEKINTCAGSRDLTFLQAYERFGRELCVVAANISHEIVEYCHYKTTPNLSIITAVRMSLATPALMSPVTHKPFREELFYIEGGMICNYPIHCFDGWWLSVNTDDSFVTKMTSAIQLPSAVESLTAHLDQTRFSKYNIKTLGFIMYDDCSGDSCTTKLDDRSKLKEKITPPQTSLSKSCAEDRLACKAIEDKYKKFATAANRLLPALGEKIPDAKRMISKTELSETLKKITTVNSEELDVFFCGKTNIDDICALIAPKRDGQVCRLDFLKYVERTAVSYESQYRRWRHYPSRFNINDLTYYLESVQSTAMYNNRVLRVTPRDIDRTVGINTRYVLRQHRGVKLEEEDKLFLIEQGRLSTRSFLDHFVLVSQPPLKDSTNRRSFCRDDLPSFIDDDVSEIIDERDYMENLIGRVL